MRGNPCADPFGLKAGREKAIGGKARAAQGAYQRINRVHIGGAEVRAVKHHRHRMRALRRGRDHALLRAIKPLRGHGFIAAHRPRIKPRRQGELRQGRLGRDRSARITQRLQAAQGGHRQGRERIEPRIVAPIGRQNGQRNAVAPREVLQVWQSCEVSSHFLPKSAHSDL